MAADLSISSWSIPSTGTVGQPITVSVKPYNGGDERSGYAFVSLYRSPDMVFDETDLLVANIGVGSVAPGKTGFQSTIVRLNQPGSYYLIPVVNADRSLAENDYGNNVGAALYITVEDAAPVLSISRNTPSVTEGTGSGTTAFTFTVTRAGDLSRTSTVNYITEGYTSSPASEYTDFSGRTQGSVTFDAGEDTKTLTILVNKDAQVENDEFFKVRLYTPTNGTVSGVAGEAYGLIKNDDSAPGAPNLDATDLELTKTTLTAGETVSWSVDVKNLGDAAAGTSTTRLYRSNDLVWDASDVLVAAGQQGALAPGQQQVNATYGATLNQVGTYYLIAVADGDKRIAESDEADNPSNAVRVTVNAAPLPVLGVAAKSADKAEGSGGGTTDFTFTVTRTGSTAGTSTVAWDLYSTSGVTIDVDDYAAPINGTLTFAAGQTKADITIKVRADRTVEKDENFAVGLKNATGARIDADGTFAYGVIRNDDTAAPARPDLDATTLTVNPTALTAGGQATIGVHVVNRGNAAAGETVVNFYRSADGVFDASDTLMFRHTLASLAAGAETDLTFKAPIPTAGTYNIIAVADGDKRIAESDEANNPSNAVRVTVKAAPLPVLGIAANAADKAEGSSGGTTDFTFTVTRTGSTAGTSTVKWDLYTVKGTTIDVNDYTGPINGTLTFAAGQTKANITIKVRADRTVEKDEGFAVGLENATGARIDANKTFAYGVIRNDDGLSRAAHDLDGDGRSDILWRNDNGATLLWQMNGETIVKEANLGTVARTTVLEDAADFNGDGRADLLWNIDGGNVFLWTMNGATATAKTTLAGPGAGWSVQDAADFGGDGRADILWRHDDGRVALWQMDGVRPLAKTTLDRISTADRIVDAADFNGDGRADILWQMGNGNAALWLMNGTNVVAKRALGSVDTQWSIADAADFNGDGRADILWRHDNGKVMMWEMNGAQMLDAAGLRTMATTWRIVDHDAIV